jgi:hypothetical protein
MQPLSSMPFFVLMRGFENVFGLDALPGAGPKDGAPKKSYGQVGI